MTEIPPIQEIWLDNLPEGLPLRDIAPCLNAHVASDIAAIRARYPKAGNLLNTAWSKVPALRARLFEAAYSRGREYDANDSIELQMSKGAMLALRAEEFITILQQVKGAENDEERRQLLTEVFNQTEFGAKLNSFNLGAVAKRQELPLNSAATSIQAMLPTWLQGTIPPTVIPEPDADFGQNLEDLRMTGFYLEMAKRVGKRVAGKSNEVLITPAEYSMMSQVITGRLSIESQKIYTRETRNGMTVMLNEGKEIPRNYAHIVLLNGVNLTPTYYVVSELMQYRLAEYSDPNAFFYSRASEREAQGFEMMFSSFASITFSALADLDSPYHNAAKELYGAMRDADPERESLLWSTSCGNALLLAETRDQMDVVSYLRKLKECSDVTGDPFYEEIADEMIMCIDKLYELRFCSFEEFLNADIPTLEPLRTGEYAGAIEDYKRLAGNKGFAIAVERIPDGLQVFGEDMPINSIQMYQFEDPNIQLVELVIGGEFKGSPLLDEERIVGFTTAERRKKFSFVVDVRSGEPVIIPHVVEQVDVNGDLREAFSLIALTMLDAKVIELRSKQQKKQAETSQPLPTHNGRNPNKRPRKPQQQVSMDEALGAPATGKGMEFDFATLNGLNETVVSKIKAFVTERGGRHKKLMGKLPDGRIIYQIYLGNDGRIWLKVTPDETKAELFTIPDYPDGVLPKSWTRRNHTKILTEK